MLNVHHFFSKPVQEFCQSKLAAVSASFACEDALVAESRLLCSHIFFGQIQITSCKKSRAHLSWRHSSARKRIHFHRNCIILCWQASRKYCRIKFLHGKNTSNYMKSHFCPVHSWYVYVASLEFGVWDSEIKWEIRSFLKWSTPPTEPEISRAEKKNTVLSKSELDFWKKVLFECPAWTLIHDIDQC